MSTEFYWVAFAATLVLSAARLTRLAVYDKFPPVQYLRNRYLDAVDGSGWGLLALCGYCMSFWITGLVLLWAWFAGVLPTGGPHATAEVWTHVWWLVNGAFAASYLAASYIANDGDDSEDD